MTPAPHAASSELVTERLLLRRWRTADEAPFVDVHRDAEVSRYLGVSIDATTARAFLARAEDHWLRYGFGLYAVEGRAGPWSGVLLGFTGIAHPAFAPEVAHRVEIGWRLRRDAWGVGLATEGALAVRDHAFSVVGLDGLVSIIHPDNERSRRVAGKLGMAVEGEVRSPAFGWTAQVWSMRRDATAPSASPSAPCASG